MRAVVLRDRRLEVRDAIVEGRLDPMPGIGEVIDLDGVPDALDRAGRSEGPPRIVVHPNG